MADVLFVTGAIFAGIAALLHVCIFALASVLWRRSSTWRRFGVRAQDDAEVLRPMAFNQGFYNLFLAIGTGTGLVLLAIPGLEQAGFALAFFALASLLLAAVVLV